MKFFRDGAVVFGIATLTAFVVPPLVGPGMARAKDELPLIWAPAAPSTLEVDGMTLSLAFHKKAYDKGDKPVLRLTAVGGKRAVTVDATVNMRTLQPASPHSRMMPIPMLAFTKQVPISVKPGETKVIDLPTGVAVDAGTTSTFDLAVGEKSTAASFSISPSQLTLDAQIKRDERVLQAVIR